MYIHHHCQTSEPWDIVNKHAHLLHENQVNVESVECLYDPYFVLCIWWIHPYAACSSWMPYTHVNVTAHDVLYAYNRHNVYTKLCCHAHKKPGYELVAPYNTVHAAMPIARAVLHLSQKRLQKGMYAIIIANISSVTQKHRTSLICASTPSRPLHHQVYDSRNGLIWLLINNQRQ